MSEPWSNVPALRERMQREVVIRHEDNSFRLGWVKAVESERRRRGEPDVFASEDVALMEEALQKHRKTRQDLEAA